MTMVARSATRPIADIAAGERESFIAACLRDTLLPTLISGELRLKQAEQFIGECI